jgi:hypothetical protein
MTAPFFSSWDEGISTLGISPAFSVSSNMSQNDLVKLIASAATSQVKLCPYDEEEQASGSASSRPNSRKWVSDHKDSNMPMLLPACPSRSFGTFWTQLMSTRLRYSYQGGSCSKNPATISGPLDFSLASWLTRSLATPLLSMSCWLLLPQFGIFAIFVKGDLSNFGLITNHLWPPCLVFSVPISPRQQRHLAFISEFNVQMLCLPGLKNVADFLSYSSPLPHPRNLLKQS